MTNPAGVLSGLRIVEFAGMVRFPSAPQCRRITEPRRCAWSRPDAAPDLRKPLLHGRRRIGLNLKTAAYAVAPFAQGDQPATSRRAKAWTQSRSICRFISSTELNFSSLLMNPIRSTDMCMP